MATRHYHGVVAAVAAVGVALLLIFIVRPELANRSDEKFKTYIDKGLTPEMRAEYDVRIATLKASIAADEKPDIVKLLRLGNLYYQTGELGLAKQEYNAILAINPKDAAALENLGQTLADMGDVSGAEARWLQALEESAQIVTVTRLVDLINESIPEHKDRVGKILELAVEQFGQDLSLVVRLGHWYREGGDYVRAQSHYEVAKQISSTTDYDELIEEMRQLSIEKRQEATP
ncbi:tetratricopeptide repeat protein [Candidatus Uhrbacteria bacterium]|nr:tetratricopeptide repeat protein [Candidatus Uhrbacteria bacterium]